MKKLFLTTLLMLATGGALAQTEDTGKWSVTPMVGVNLNEPDFKGAFFDDSNFGLFELKREKANVEGGFENITTNIDLRLQVSVQYSLFEIPVLGKSR